MRVSPPHRSDLVAGDLPSVLQFYDWDTAHKVGPELAEPLILAWDPSLTFCALAYSAQVVIATTQPTFQVGGGLWVGLGLSQ